MSFRCGTDIIRIDRVKESLLNQSTGQRMKERIFAKEEILYCESKGRGSFQSFAARFAGKEAFAKAMGTGFGEFVHPNEVVILNDDSGKPFVQLRGETNLYFKKKDYSIIEISLSHEDNYAIAFIIIS